MPEICFITTNSPPSLIAFVDPFQAPAFLIRELTGVLQSVVVDHPIVIVLVKHMMSSKGP